MSDTVHFRKAVNITPPGKDGYVFAFPFCLVPAEISASDTNFFTSDYRIIISISSVKAEEWSLDSANIEAALSRIAKAEVDSRLQNKTISKRMELDISSTSHSGPIPSAWNQANPLDAK